MNRASQGAWALKLLRLDFTGVLFAAVFFCLSLTPSLLPRDWLMGGIIGVEKVFNYPGLGNYMIDSISDRDLPVVQAIALILAAVYVGVNLAADMLGMLLNPRFRTLRSRAR